MSNLKWNQNHPGWLDGAQWVESPNFNRRPSIDDVSLLVVHNISLPAGHFSGDDVQDLFCNQLDLSRHESYKSLDGLRVSAHFFVRRDGLVIQFVSTDDRAWHAGQSSWLGRSDCNNFSVGVELEGTDYIPYEDVQYDVLLDITRLLRERYPITAIAGHCDIAPSRKTDPGKSFDWDRFSCQVQQQESSKKDTIRFRY
jgi:AmpD protein